MFKIAHFLRKKLKNKHFQLLLVMLLAFFLRMIYIEQSLWLDESIGAWAVKNFTYKGIIDEFLLSDNHPPLYYLILKFWTSIFGYSETVIRMPSVISGIGTILFTYWILKESNNRWEILNSKQNTAIIAALFLATSPLHIYYSQEARMYSLAALFASSSVYFFLKTTKAGSMFDWIFFSASLVGLITSDYMPIFLFPVFWIIALVGRKNKEWRKKFLISHTPLILIGLWWYPVFLIQSEKGRWLLQTLPAWKDLAGGASLKQALLVGMKFILGRISFSPKHLYYSLVVLASVPFIVSFLKIRNLIKEMNSMIWIILLWLVVPLALGFMASFFFPAFTYFRYIYVLPAFYILTAVGISKSDNRSKQGILLLLVLLVNFSGLGIYYFDESQHREDWRAAANFIDINATTEDVVLFEYPQPFTPYRWYSNSKQISFGATNSISADRIETQEITRELINEKKRVFHFDYLKDLSDPQNVVESTLKRQGYQEKSVYNFRGVGQIGIWEK